MNYAPITLFVYNRPKHTRETIAALKNNPEAKISDLFIFSDGPKSFNPKDEKVKAVRDYLKTITGFKKITITERKSNIGLAQSIILGVTEVVNKYGKIIVLEDDLIVSSNFLKYMNEALFLYEKEERVISIHGYNYPLNERLPDTFFLRGSDCWGWATWERGWRLFESNGLKLLRQLRKDKLIDEFDFYNSYPYTKMLKEQISGKNNSWAIRWYASAFLKNKLTLYPGKSLVINIGLDGSGTHCGNDKLCENLLPQPININLKKIKIEENYHAKLLISKYFKKEKKILPRLINKLKILLK